MGLENQKASILHIEYEKARLASRMVWMEAGDSNCNFFYNFTNHRRNVNFIWVMKSKEGLMIKYQGGISMEAHAYFKSYFIGEGNIQIIE